MSNSIYYASMDLAFKLKRFFSSMLNKSQTGRSALKYAIFMAFYIILVVVALFFGGEQINTAALQAVCRFNPEATVTNLTTGVSGSCRDLGFIR